MKSNNDYMEVYHNGGLYSGLRYGAPGVSKGLYFARYLKDTLASTKKKILCIGCGNGFEVLEYINQGHDAYGTETHDIPCKALEGRIYNAVCPGLPFKEKEFDLIHCTEVMEHIDPALTDPFLEECKRLSKNVFFSIATKPDIFDTHINLLSPEAWLDKFLKMGFVVKNFQYKPNFYNFYGSVMVANTYAEGVMIDAACDL